MTAQPNQGFIFAASAASEIRRRPCLLPVDVATHTVAVYRAGGGADPETTCWPSETNAAASPIGGSRSPASNARRTGATSVP